MRTAKSGAWWNGSGQRALANNSACYTERPDFEFFMREMSALYESKSGERGVFSRVAAKKIAGRNGRRDPDHEFGTNPCSEILLRSGGVCNLSEVIVRADDDLDSLKEKVRLATILGTLQATLTDFRYVRTMWKRNAEEEALLGVSFTGIMDNTMMAGVSDPEALLEWLTELKQVAIDTNLEWSERLGISQAAAITCVKPSGTVSQLCDTASGIHPRFAPHYIRTVRQDNKDPVTQFLMDQGVDAEPCVMKPDSTTIFSFRMEAPKNAVCVSDVGALEQLKLWKIYQDAWCEHKPSITVYYTDDEFFDICAWMWKNFDSMSGVSLLPYDGGTYQQAPYQQIDKAQYEEEVQREPSINWEALSQYETDDQTTGSQELACVGTSCELP
jgi:ribonucleoside-diphosphate reductase alpha chain